MNKLVFTLIFFCILQNKSFSQDTLPNISVTQISRKVIISWTNPFTTVTNINIQRSYDSLKNFTTIGSVLNVKAKTNGFVDSKEFIPPQYYRVFISFEGGTYLFTPSHKPGVESTKTVTNLEGLTEGKEFSELKKIMAVPPPVRNWFVPSKLVYTGKENNVIISLPDAEKKKYSIKFFEEDGTPLFEIKKISEPYLTLDKVNFIHAGLFKFEVYEKGILIEKHEFYIPKDGQSMPALDINGHELR
jgi:hypothetical protein